jgi:hypothetical protein
MLLAIITGAAAFTMGPTFTTDSFTATCTLIIVNVAPTVHVTVTGADYTDLNVRHTTPPFPGALTSQPFAHIEQSFTIHFKYVIVLLLAIITAAAAFTVGSTFTTDSFTATCTLIIVNVAPTVHVPVMATDDQHLIAHSKPPFPGAIPQSGADTLQGGAAKQESELDIPLRKVPPWCGETGTILKPILFLCLHGWSQ